MNTKQTIEVTGSQPREWYTTANTVRFHGPLRRDREVTGIIIDDDDWSNPPPPYGGVYARDRSITGDRRR